MDLAVNPFPAKSFDPVTPLTHRMVSEEPNDKFKVSTWLCPAAVATSVSALCGKFAEESTTLSCALWLPHATCTGKVKVSDRTAHDAPCAFGTVALAYAVSVQNSASTPHLSFKRMDFPEIAWFAYIHWSKNIILNFFLISPRHILMIRSRFEPSLLTMWMK